MVLGARTRWERGSGVGGCHPGRGGLRAGSIRSIPGIRVGVSERGPGTGGNVAGYRDGQYMLSHIQSFNSIHLMESGKHPREKVEGSKH